jgi:hypothetical protein
MRWLVTVGFVNAEFGIDITFCIQVLHGLSRNSRLAGDAFERVPERSQFADRLGLLITCQMAPEQVHHQSTNLAVSVIGARLNLIPRVNTEFAAGPFAVIAVENGAVLIAGDDGALARPPDVRGSCRGGGLGQAYGPAPAPVAGSYATLHPT